MTAARENTAENFLMGKYKGTGNGYLQVKGQEGQQQPDCQRMTRKKKLDKDTGSSARAPEGVRTWKEPPGMALCIKGWSSHSLRG